MCEYGDLLCGYQLACEGELVVNPPDKRSPIAWTARDLVVVVCSVRAVFNLAPLRGVRASIAANDAIAFASRPSRDDGGGGGGGHALGDLTRSQTFPRGRHSAAPARAATRAAPSRRASKRSSMRRVARRGTAARSLEGEFEAPEFDGP